MLNITFDQKESQQLTSHYIQGIILFGSHATGTHRPHSDVDIAVIAHPKLATDKTTYNFLYDLLSSKISGLVNIDIVFLATAPPELKQHVMRHGQVLYQSSPYEFPRFKEKTMIELSDLAPIREIFATAILNRIPS